MARKRKLSPTATGLIIAGISITGFLIWKFVIQKKRDQKYMQIPMVDSTIDSEFQDVTEQNIT